MEEEKYPEQTFTKTVNGVLITVDAPEGAFPEGTEMFASEVATSAVVDAVDEATDYDVTKSDVKAYDITFKKDGKEIQPKTAVEVSFKNVDLDGDELVLGDMVLSLERAKEQSIEYNHSFNREVCYLVVHSILHLLGYDHMEDEEKKRMRKREEEILGSLNITR